MQAAIGQTRRYQRFYRNGQAKLGFVVFGSTESRCIKVTQVEAGREEDRRIILNDQHLVRLAYGFSR